MALEPLKFTVPFDEADGEGIVFFGNYFRLAHRALEQYLPQLGISWEEWFSHAELAVPLRHAEADFMHPLRPGQKFTIAVGVEKIGDSSVQFVYDLRGSEGQPAAKLKTTHVFITRKSVQKTEIPARVREALIKGLV